MQISAFNRWEETFKIALLPLAKKVDQSLWFEYHYKSRNRPKKPIVHFVFIQAKSCLLHNDPSLSTDLDKIFDKEVQKRFKRGPKEVQKRSKRGHKKAKKGTKEVQKWPKTSYKVHKRLKGSVEAHKRLKDKIDQAKFL